MFAWFGKFLNNRAGNASVEAALVLPILIVMFAGVAEIGRGLYQTVAIEKGLRAGALYLARSELPITQSMTDTAVTLVKTGGSPHYLADGWADASATVEIETQDFIIDGTTVPVFRLSASVPFDPLFSNLVPGLDLSIQTIKLSHEQPHVGL